MAIAIQELRAHVGELLAADRLRALYDDAKRQGITLTARLEQEDPSDAAERGAGLDAFERLLAAAGIVVRSDPRGGYHADRLEAFAQDPARKLLFPEWAARIWRSAQFRAPAQVFSTDLAAGSVLRPYVDDATLREPQVAPAIPLEEVVALTTPIAGSDYRAAYLVDPDPNDVRQMRVGEAAELPRARLQTTQRAIALRKFGRAIEASYEALRRQPLDLVAAWIRRVAVQAQADQVAAALDVAINGDGNPDTAAEVLNLTALDPETEANQLTARAWIRFRAAFRNPYTLRAVFAREAAAVDLQLLNVGTANQLLAVLTLPGLNTQLTPINQSLAGGVRLGLTDDVPSAVLVGMDTALAVQRVVEVGSQINEAERWIERQVEILTLSENEAYVVWDPKATKVLNLAA